jgi:AraC-like DNA-binding protein
MKYAVPTQLRRFLETIGLDLADLFQRAGLPDRTWQDTITLTPMAYYQFLQAIDSQLTDEQILTLSNIANVQFFFPPLFAALTAQNGYQAIQRLAAYKQLIGPVTAHLTENTTTVAVHYDFIYPAMAQTRLALLFEQLSLLSLLRTGTQQHIVPLKIKSPVTYGPAIQDYCDVMPLASDDNQIVFTKAALQKPFQTENNVMWQYLEPTLKAKLAQLTAAASLAATIRKDLITAIPSGQFSIEAISETLGLSPRTLQRKLAQEKTTFNKLLQATQSELAVNYLQDFKLSNAEIAYLVGYAEPSAFARAFHRWTGETLAQYRKQLAH